MADTPPEEPLRRTLLFVLVVLLLACLSFAPADAGGFVRRLLGLGAGPGQPQFLLLIAFLRLLIIVLCSLLPLLTAVVIGRRITAWTGLEIDRAENWVFSCALGFGAIAPATLAVGATVGLSRFVFLSAVVAVCILGRRDILALFGGLGLGADRLGRRTGLLGPALLGLPALALVFLAFLACYVPPLDYDVLEYHLGAPAYWLREGRICFIRYNVYSNFPFNTEMLYLFSMVLTGDKMVGAAVAKLVNLQFGLLGSVAIGLAARRLFDPRAGWVAALCFLACPWFTRSAVRAYDTLALSFYTFLAVYYFYCHLSQGGERDGPTKWLWRGALMTGLAMGTKYPSFLFVWAPAVIGVLVTGVVRKAPRTRLFRHTAVIVLVPLLLAGPWLLRNVAHTRNPVFPLLGSVFNGPEWDAPRDAKFAAAHQAPALGPWQLVQEGARLAFAGKGSSLLLLVFLLPLIWRPDRARARYFLGYVLLYFLLWAYSTHRIDRFFVPALPALCVLAGAGFSACREKIARGLATCMLGALLVLHAFQGVVLCAGDDLLDLDALAGDADAYLERKLSHEYEAIQYLNQEARDTDKVLFVGDAKTFYCDRNYFVAATVFDHQWLDAAIRAGLAAATAGRGPAISVVEGSAGDPEFWEGVARYLKESLGVSYLYVHWPEIYRLQGSYAYAHEGVRRPGYLSCLPPVSTQPGLSEEARFQQFMVAAYRTDGGVFGRRGLGRHLRLAKSFGPTPRGYPPLIAVYRLEAD